MLNNRDTPARQTHAASRGWKLFCFALAVITFFQLFTFFYAGLSGDRVWLWYATEAWQGGQTLYRDIFEVNPPLIIFLYSLPFHVARFIPWLEGYQWVLLCMLALAGLSTLLCLRLLREYALIAGHSVYRRVAGIMLIFVLFLLPNYTHFADREYIFATLCLPYFLRFMPGLRQAKLPLWLRLSIGSLAAIGFCIKPQTALVWLPTQLFWIVKERAPRQLFLAENLLCYAGGALYLVSIYVFTPDYFCTVLPMALAAYSGYRMEMQDYVFRLLIVLFPLGVFFVDFRRTPASKFRADIHYLLALVVGGYLYVFANQGWGYTFEPLWMFVALLGAWLFMEYHYLHAESGAPITQKRTLSGMRGIGIVFAYLTAWSLFNSGEAVRDTRRYGSPYSDIQFKVFSAMKQTIAAARAPHSFSIYSTSFPWFRLPHDTHAIFASRFNSLWMAPAMASASQKWIADYVTNALAEDLAHYKPAIVFVDTSPRIRGFNDQQIDLLRLFRKSPVFAAAWKSYAHDGTIDYCYSTLHGYTGGECRYMIYKRISHE